MADHEHDRDDAPHRRRRPHVTRDGSPGFRPKPKAAPGVQRGDVPARGDREYEVDLDQPRER